MVSVTSSDALATSDTRSEDPQGRPMVGLLCAVSAVRITVWRFDVTSIRFLRDLGRAAPHARRLRSRLPSGSTGAACRTSHLYEPEPCSEVPRSQLRR